MGVISFRAFGGLVPRLPADRLPEGAAQDARNCDLLHGELRPQLGNTVRFSGLTVNGRPIRSVYTEDGHSYFGWEYDTSVVKSLVVEDDFYRIYYTIETDAGPFIKVARTKVHTDDVGQGPVEPVIGSVREVGGNFQPPENGALHTYPNGWGPHAWLLGVPAPKVQATSEDDKLVATLEDRKEWPGIPRLSLKATFFVEDPAGQIVAQYDITNTNTLPGYDNVFTDTDPAKRGYKIQDTYANIGAGQRPYKNYFFTIPDIDILHVARTVAITASGGAITINYSGGTTPDPESNPESGAIPTWQGGA